MKRMKSEKHGFCHAHDGNEEAYLRKLGWIEESESFPSEAAVLEPAAGAAVSDQQAPKASPVPRPRAPKKAKA